jgi:tetratricopeptide (TPR) repeat protein
MLLAGMLAVLPCAAFAQAQPAPQPTKTDVTINTAGGFARIVFNFAQTNEADIRMSSGVLVITFRNPVEIDVTRLFMSNGYVSAARRDPDGKGVRLALLQNVRVSSMVAGERFFVDLLPDSWTAAAPPLPKEVVEDLARRAREAEKRSQQTQVAAKQRVAAATRVRVSRQPTFTRYVFELPEFISVNADRGKDKLTLAFDAVLRFDMADAKASQPPVVQSIETKFSESSTSVIISLIGKADIRSFREDNNYVVDVVTSGPSGRPNDAVVPDASKSEPAASLEPKPDIGLSLSIESVIEKKEPPRAIVLPKPSLPESPARAPNADATPARAPNADATPAKPAAATAPRAVPPPPMAAAPPNNVPAAQTIQNVPQDPKGIVPVGLQQRTDSIVLTMPFAVPTPAAVFTRADTLWLVFDTGAPLDAAAVAHDSLRDATVVQEGDLQIVRLKLDRPRLVSVALEDATWTIHLADAVVVPAQPLAVMRNVTNTPRASAHVPFEDPRAMHRIEDPEIGDALVVVTAMGPPRGIPKTQDFVDFRTLASAQGVVIQPLADDLKVELAGDRVMIGRPSGLTLTSAAPVGAAGPRTGVLRPVMFDPQQWGFDRQASFLGRSTSLITAAAQASEAKRPNARLELARFYFARDMYPEAKGVLDVALVDNKPDVEDTTGLVMRGVAKILMGRPDEGLKDINHPVVGTQNDAPLWRALASAKQGKWAEARDGFRKIEVAVGMLPIELQRELLKEAVRASIEVGDFAAAANQLNDFETLGVQPDAQPWHWMLSGRIHEGLGRSGDALVSYRAAADSADRASAAQARLRETTLRYKLGDLKRPDVITDLETLTATWRGDESEIEALQLLAKLYIEEGRYRDAFNIMRVAVKVHPHSEQTRGIQEDAASTFDKLFLGGKVDSLPAIDALSLFYDFRELIPIGRRGDEMIRRLTDRLVLVDLLGQAAELLQHQIDHRLQGAARAQVATRLAAIYLINRKPERAIQVLKSTRSNELSTEIRSQRLLLEARALSDTGRAQVALEVVENIDGPEAVRARSDILWGAKRFREAAEQLELLYGDRWRDWTPLNDTERREVLRAALGYNFGEDTIGLERFREKFGPVMLQGPDRKAFEIVTAPMLAVSEEFNQIARTIAAVDTLDQFLRDIRARAAEMTPPSAQSGRPMSHSRLRDADMTPTGSILGPQSTSDEPGAGSYEE